MRLPRLAAWLLKLGAPDDRREDVLGDFEEVHRERVGRHGRWIAAALTNLEAIEAAALMLAARVRAIELVSVSWLDVKLGIRMLVKYPGLTFVGGLAMAFAIWVGAITYEILGQMWHPELPFDGGDRVVAILNRDLIRSRRSLPFPADYIAWGEQLRTVQEIAAFRDVVPNLTVTDRGTAPIEAAEISARGIALPHVPPLLGRLLTSADEQPGAPAVIVLGYEAWQTRFGADPHVIGTTAALDGEPTTVVGVMPGGFAFPVSHAAWVPLGRPPVGAEPGEGRPVVVFGRLAPGITEEAAQAELDALGARRSRLFPETLGQVRPQVMPFGLALRPLPDLGPVGLIAVNLFILTLFALIAGSVALLVWARSATRARELAVRSALGAGRGRIAMQFFTEALVLGGAAAVVGLLAANSGVGWYIAMSEADSGPLPFWVSRSIGLSTVAYLCGLTVLGAVIVGVVPAFRATGRNVGARLRGLDPRGRLRLQGLWGKVIVAQIAVTVVFPATSFLVQRYVSNIRTFDLGFREGAFVSARLELPNPEANTDEPTGTPADRVAAVYDQLKERLERNEAGSSVTFASRLPGEGLPNVRVELDAPGSGSVGPSRVSVASVGPDFFRAVGAPILAGRGFTGSHQDAGAAGVVVNQAFVDQVLRGRSAVGRRLRVRPPDERGVGPWLEIVGVVGGLAMVDAEDLDVTAAPGLYQVLAPGSAYPLSVVVQVRGGIGGFASRLRATAADVDPRLRVLDIRDMSRVSDSLWRESEFLSRILAGVSLVALALSLTVIFSVLSLTVSQRTREIGIRVALGSRPHDLVVSIFGTPLVYVSTGIVVGAVLVTMLAWAGRGGLTVLAFGSVLAYSTCMFGVCLLACIVPTRRALGVEPMEALRAEE